MTATEKAIWILLEKAKPIKQKPKLIIAKPTEPC